MKIEANAKINLTLDVVKKRSDGYHELDMIMMPLSLCDTLHVDFSDHDEIICGTSNFPLDESNTIYKAILLMREKFALNKFFKVIVEKSIPMKAGLAGGSADGAAMLKAIVSMCAIEISEEELILIAKKIGADVPFCVVNKPARVQGIGEQVRQFEYDCPFYLLLVKPSEGVSTALAFSNIAFDSCIHPNVQQCEDALLHDDYKALCTCIGNTLEQSAFEITPLIKQIKSELKEDGFDSVLMSGSGSTVFAITRNITLIHDCQKKYDEKYGFAQVCQILNK